MNGLTHRNGGLVEQLKPPNLLPSPTLKYTVALCDFSTTLDRFNQQEWGFVTSFCLSCHHAQQVEKYSIAKKKKTCCTPLHFSVTNDINLIFPFL